MFTRIGLMKDRGNAAFKRNLSSCVMVSLVIVSLSFVFETTVSALSVASQSRYAALYEAEFYEQVLDYVKTAQISEIFSKAFRFMLPILYTMALTLCLQILFTNPMTVSYSRFFMENSVKDIEGKRMFFVFKNGYYPTVAWKMFLRDVYIFAWSLLFLVPGIVKGYSYSMVPHILAENPELDRKRVFEISKQMMKGHRVELFVLEISFIGWMLVGMVTYGIVNAIYTNPYMQATSAEFYFERKEEAKKNKVFTQDELPVFEVKRGKASML